MIVENVRSLWTGIAAKADDVRPTEAASGTSSSSPDSKLFTCPRCDVVYLALEKDVCSSCRGEVQEVSTSLSH